MSSIAFGQCDTIIKPVKRYIQEGDTFTVFTLNGERCLAQKIQRGHELVTEVKLLNDVVVSFKQERVRCDSALNSADRVIAGRDSALVVKGQQLQNCEQRAENYSNDADKFRRQRNGVAGGALVFILLALLL